MKLVVQTGRDAGREFPLTGSIISIGRGPGNDIVPNDSQVSRRHAELRRQGSKLAITDLGSTNGTFINDVRLRAPQLLRHGDRVRVGTTTYSFRMMPSAPPMGEAVRQPVARQGTSPLPFFLAAVAILIVIALVLFAPGHRHSKHTIQRRCADNREDLWRISCLHLNDRYPSGGS
jgi:pSer/pThr/pTyr-binding forkhead associated (FHA) protein